MVDEGYKEMKSNVLVLQAGIGPILYMGWHMGLGVGQGQDSGVYRGGRVP